MVIGSRTTNELSVMKKIFAVLGLAAAIPRKPAVLFCRGRTAASFIPRSSGAESPKTAVEAAVLIGTISFNAFLRRFPVN